MNPLDRWFPRIVLAACLVLCGLECPAKADTGSVDAAHLCAVNHALRGKWSPKMCERVADALNETPDPVMFAAMAVNESDLREGVVAEPKPGVLDIGLLGVRCILDKRDRCMNAPVIGRHWTELANPEKNIHAAAVVLAMHKGSLRRYNGGTTERGYGARIMALVAAFSGELRIPKGAHGRQWARIRELARRIVEAIGKERRS